MTKLLTDTAIQPNLSLAVLIDADNTQPSIVEGLMAEIARYGTAGVKRIYGDWTNPRLRGWKDVLLEWAIQPIQQFAYTTGKNATDSAMIIDAMDLLYTEKLQGFCIVSSDSDFTRLASRLREAGLTVFGFGEQKTPRPFVAACDKFIYTEILRKDEKATAQTPLSVDRLQAERRLINLIRSAVEDAADECSWAYLGNVGKNLMKKSPEFDPRNYGYIKLGELIRATDLFEIDERRVDNAPGTAIYIRYKDRDHCASPGESA